VQGTEVLDKVESTSPYTGRRTIRKDATECTPKIMLLSFTNGEKNGKESPLKCQSTAAATNGPIETVAETA